MPRQSRPRTIGAGAKYRPEFLEHLLLCLMYYRTHTSHIFSATGFRYFLAHDQPQQWINDGRLMAGHFRPAERTVRLTDAQKDDLGFCRGDRRRGTTCTAAEKALKAQEKQRTIFHQIITDNTKRIRAVEPAHDEHRHDKRNPDETSD